MRWTVAQIIERRVTVVDSGCWNWSSVAGNGYGCVRRDDGKQVNAHRFIYEALVGPIPAGCDLDHLCRNRRCVNPDHLEPVSRRENLLRGDTIPAAHKAATHCKNGHAYTEENTYHRPDAPWIRDCRTCRRESDRRRRR